MRVSAIPNVGATLHASAVATVVRGAGVDGSAPILPEEFFRNAGVDVIPRQNLVLFSGSVAVPVDVEAVFL